MKNLIYLFMVSAMLLTACGETEYKIIPRDAEGRPLDKNRQPLTNVNWCSYYIDNIKSGSIPGIKVTEGICIKCTTRGEKCPDYASGREITITDGTQKMVVRITAKGVPDNSRTCGDCIFATSQDEQFSDFVEE